MWIANNNDEINGLMVGKLTPCKSSNPFAVDCMKAAFEVEGRMQGSFSSHLFDGFGRFGIGPVEIDHRLCFVSVPRDEYPKIDEDVRLELLAKGWKEMEHSASYKMQVIYEGFTTETPAEELVSFLEAAVSLLQPQFMTVGPFSLEDLWNS
jgi:hypothetical protein